jgi:hypothetical protein
MLKNILAFTAAALLLAPCVHAQYHRDAAAGRVAYARPNHWHGGGRYYYFGGVPYFYPFYGIGFGYPYYYDYGYGYPGYPGYYGDVPPPGDAPYEGRITDSSSAGHNGPSMTAVVQQQLAKRGYYKGAIDGDFGPASRSALSRFQRENGLKETGRIDEPTLMALGFSDHR